MAAAAPIIALLSAGLALVGVLGAFTGLLAPMAGFSTFAAGALLGGIFSAVVALVGLFLTRGGADPKGRMKALIGLAISLGLLIVVLGAASTSGDAPPINDITTDLADPPAYADPGRVADYRGRDMSYPAEFVPVVREHYGDLAPLRLAVPPSAAFDRARSAAEGLGWEIALEDAGAGLLYARDVSSIFKFVDDVAVRVRPDGSGAQIDVRSKSRDGRSDLGANARRIRSYFEAIGN